MAKQAFSSLEIIRKKSRSDGDQDMLVKVINKEGNELFVAVRKSTDQLTSAYIHEKTDSKQARNPLLSRKLHWQFVSCKASRVLKSSLNSLYEQFPQVFSSDDTKANQAFANLRQDERLQQDRIKLSQRAWRIHEVALFPNGKFIARLSCTKPENVLADTQFVIRSANSLEESWEKTKPSFKLIIVVSEFDNQYLQVRERYFDRCLESQHSWYFLTDALGEATKGYSTEIDAKKRFESLVKSSSYGFGNPEKQYRFDVANSVRQAGQDRETRIEITDTFMSNLSENWLMETDKGHLILSHSHRTFRDSEARLLGHYKTIAFESPVATTRRLLKLADKPPYMEAEQAQVSWEKVVKHDLEARFRSEQYHAEWHFRDWAILEDGRHAFRATCLLPVKAEAPIEFPRPCWRILVTGEREVLFETIPVIIDFSSGDYLTSFIDGNPCDEFIKALEVLGTDDDRWARDLIINEFLVRSDGYFTENDAEAAWLSLTENAVINSLDGKVSPLPPRIRKLHLYREIEKRRERIALRLQAEGDLADPEELDSFDRSISEGFQYPEKILQYGERMGWITREGDEISIVETPSSSAENCDEKPIDDSAGLRTSVRYEKHVDKKDEIDLPPAAPSTTIPDLRRDEKQVDDISSLQDGIRDDKIVDENTVGRPRKWEDDRERKREWARRHRKKLQAEKALSKEPQPKRGRPAIYESPAERQRAYRKRKKLQLTSSAKD